MDIKMDEARRYKSKSSSRSYYTYREAPISLPSMVHDRVTSLLKQEPTHESLIQFVLLTNNS